jgi:hypothetical protein
MSTTEFFQPTKFEIEKIRAQLTRIEIELNESYARWEELESRVEPPLGA